MNNNKNKVELVRERRKIEGAAAGRSNRTAILNNLSKDQSNRCTRSGFLFYHEWIIVILIVGILSAIASPHIAGPRRDAIADKIVCDFNAISKASVTSFSEVQEFPATSDWGKTPDELTCYLPPNFKFEYKNVTYRWRRWSLPSGLPRRPDQNVLLGLQVRTKDPRMVGSIVKVYQGRITQLKEKQVTFVIL